MPFKMDWYGFGSGFPSGYGLGGPYGRGGLYGYGGMGGGYGYGRSGYGSGGHRYGRDDYYDSLTMRNSAGRLYGDPYGRPGNGFQSWEPRGWTNRERYTLPHDRFGPRGGESGVRELRDGENEYGFSTFKTRW